MNCLALIPVLLAPIFADVNGDLSEQQQRNLCAQVRAESLFDPSAVSRSGARGLSQFMSFTWGDNARGLCTPFDKAFDPLCNLTAHRRYMRMLLRSKIAQGTNPQERWAFATASYNAGLGHIRAERRLCAGPLHPRCDPTRWFGHVETTCRRRQSACEETRGYNERIWRFGARETEAIP